MRNSFNAVSHGGPVSGLVAKALVVGLITTARVSLTNMRPDAIKGKFIRRNIIACQKSRTVYLPEAWGLAKIPVKPERLHYRVVRDTYQYMYVSMPFWTKDSEAAVVHRCILLNVRATVQGRREWSGLIRPLTRRRNDERSRSPC